MNNRIANQIGIKPTQVAACLTLIKDGATVPFISRYRKEVTGHLDEVQVAKVKELYEKELELEKRKQSILKAIEEQGKLTAELKGKIEDTFDSTELEDLYLPYKKKRQTKAEQARKNGLEPLAKIIMSQREHGIDGRAMSFVKGEVKDVDAAIQGAKDIIAEWVNESTAARNTLRTTFERQAIITSKLVKGKEEEGEKFKDYFKFEEKLNRCRSHRLLAIRRGEQEGILKVSIRPSEKEALERINRIFVKRDPDGYVEEAVKEAYKRLLAPSIENEFAALTKEQADKEAIEVFAENLRQLLLAAPLGKKATLALDPGFRTGCKLVCLDEKGDLKHNTTIYPHAPQNQMNQAIAEIEHLVKKYKIEAIAIGNGTAGRETESMVRSMNFEQDVAIFSVNESGASIYSASEVAREEFPNHDVTVRGAVSIGRRLMDPLAELVKIDAKSIGVGQYQHDVDQKLLKNQLDQVVESCVNNVGVDLNTASKQLLSYVSGLGPQLAQNIIDFRSENGLFTSRAQLKKVARMGSKAFEQCAGFLRVKESKNPLDNSAVHPESYPVVKEIAKSLNATVEDLVGNESLVKSINTTQFQSESIGEATLKDICKELIKPGLDPREQAEQFSFSDGIHSIDDLQEGMVVNGLVTNITNFGCFVDVGVKQDGLVHISNLANEYISNPADYVKLNQQVQVKVLEVDAKRKRVGLSMKDV